MLILAALVATLTTADPVPPPELAHEPGLELVEGTPGIAPIRFLGLELPTEAESGGTLEVTFWYAATEPMPAGHSPFLHLDPEGDCGRIVFDRPLPPPEGGLIRHHLRIPIPRTCRPGSALVLGTGIFALSDGHRWRTVSPALPDNRIHAGRVAIVEHAPAPERGVWTVARLYYEHAFDNRHPVWVLPVGVLAALGLLALAWRTRIMRRYRLDHPGLARHLEPLLALERLVSLALLVLALTFVVQFVGLAWDTVGYPYQFEWMEGGVVETVQRLADGESIYGPPTIDYVPYIYTPGYVAATWLVSLVTGVDFFAARLVSFLAIMGVAALIVRFVQREIGGRRGLYWGLVGAGILFATFPLSGRWYHLARVDALFVFLLFLPLYLLRFRTSMASAVVAGVLMTACAFTKQSALLAFLPPVGLAFLGDRDLRRRAFVAGLVFVATLVLGFLVAQALSDGWFAYYIFDVPGRHDMVDEAYRTFWKNDLWAAAPLLCASAAGVAMFAARAGHRAWLYIGLFIGFVACAWVSRLHSGGWMNVLMPAFAALALCAPLGLATLDERHAAEEHTRLGGSPTRIGLALFLGLQLAVLAWPSGPSRPPAGDLERGERFLAYLRAIDGDVLLPDLDFIQRRAGKHNYAQGMAARDLLRVTDPQDRGRVALYAELQRAFAERRFAAVILSEEGHLRELLMPGYCLKERIDFAPTPTTGWVIRPEWVWVRRPADVPPNRVSCEGGRR